ncbi:hypothetical protein ACLQ2R_03250 [Streptosporangium sp. DT93]|uniref:hypothetical protein n=1 Tax=Streptosporangium sp. DT93 TaxID=3393428 RepID=UPI003CEE108F
MTSRPDPLVAFDIRDSRNWWKVTNDSAYHESLLEWMRAQGMNPSITYRLEIHLIDCPSARIYEYDLNSDGHRYSVGNDLARREPYEVILPSLPPERTLR